MVPLFNVDLNSSTLQFPISILLNSQFGIFACMNILDALVPLQNAAPSLLILSSSLSILYWQ